MKVANSSIQAKTYLIIYFLFSLISCNFSTQNNVEFSKKKNLEIKGKLNWIAHYESWERSRHKLIKEVEREFRIRNQEIDVSVYYPSDLFKDEPDGYKANTDLVVSMIKSGEYKYDIIDMDPGRYWNIADGLLDYEWGKKYLVDFKQFDWFINRHQEFIISSPDFSKKNSNIIPGPYLEGVYGTLWVNTNVLEKIGASLKQFNITINDFHDYLDKVEAYNKDASKKIAFLYTELGYDSFFDFARVLYMSAYFSESEKEGNEEAAINALERLAKELEYLHERTQLKNPIRWGDIAKDPILRDEALFSVIPTYAYSLWQTKDSANALNIIPCQLPIFEHDSKYYPGQYQTVMGVLKNSPNVENAIELVKYLCSESVAERWTAYSKSPTGLKTRIKSSDFDQNKYDLYYNFIDNKYSATLSDFRPMNIAFGSNHIGPYYDHFQDLYKVLFGEVTAEEYMAKFYELK